MLNATEKPNEMSSIGQTQFLRSSRIMSCRHTRSTPICGWNVKISKRRKKSGIAAKPSSERSASR